MEISEKPAASITRIKLSLSMIVGGDQGQFAE
jgi:hypothetical protein